MTSKPPSDPGVPMGDAKLPTAHGLEGLRSVDVISLDQLLEVRRDQGKLEELRHRAEELQSKHTDAVRKRVLEDYNKRGADLDAKAKPLVVQVRTEYGKLRTLLAEIIAARDAATLEKEELEFRREIGELDDKEVNGRLEGPTSTLEQCALDLSAVEEQQKLFLRALGNDVDPPVSAPPPAKQEAAAAPAAPPAVERPPKPAEPEKREAEKPEERAKPEAVSVDQPKTTVFAAHSIDLPDLPAFLTPAGPKPSPFRAPTPPSPPPPVPPPPPLPSPVQSGPATGSPAAWVEETTRLAHSDGDGSSPTVLSTPGPPIPPPFPQAQAPPAPPRLSGSESPTFMLPAAALIVTPPAGSPVEHRLLALNQLGRSEDNHIQVSTLGVSRRHAQIVATTAGFLLRDLQSQNGTFVNGERITERDLVDGDRITIGDTVLLYRSPWPVG